MTPVQCKMARAATGLSVRQLEEVSEISYTTVTRYENSSKANITTINKMKEALESAGVEFIAENGGGVGVRLKK